MVSILAMSVPGSAGQGEGWGGITYLDWVIRNACSLILSAILMSQ